MRPLSHMRVIASIAAIFTTSAQAILDTNNNSISDLFERQYNNGNLLPNTFLATNDNDKDGWSNAKEATAGTNPFDPNPPDGIVALTITPSLIEGSFTLTWNTLVGKNYQLKVSTDLINWSNLGDPITTTQNTHTIGVNTTQPDFTIPPTVFWQITVTDLDTDLDGLTNAEEHILGTDPLLLDSDGDTLNDKAEILAGTKPLEEDTDLDGIPDNLDATPLLNNAIADPDGENLAASLSTNLRGFWDFESQQGTAYPAVLPDRSGGGRHSLSYSGGPQAQGIPSMAAKISPQYVTIPPNTFQGQNTWTISGWLKFTKNGIINQGTGYKVVYALYDQQGTGPAPQNAPLAQGTILAVAKVGSTENWFVGGYKQTTYFNEYPNINGNPKTVYNGHNFTLPAGTLDDGKWHHFAVTRASIANGQKVYFDGALIFQGALLDYTVSYDANTTFTFGRLFPAHTASILPEAWADRLRVHSRLLNSAEITALYKQDIDHDGLWDITELKTLQNNYVTSVTSHPLPGTPLPATVGQYIRSPYYFEDPATDTDGDGLTDIEEQTLGTDLTKPDTDGDGLLDGWEVEYDFDPLVAGNDDTSDPDGDGLTNLQEYFNNTHPRNANTDGSAGNDQQEVINGSDPADSDNDTAPPAGEMENLPITINGDYTKWEVILVGLGPDDLRVRRFRMDNYNNTKSANLPIRKGNSYELSMIYQSTIPGQEVPWYCWEAKIDGKTDESWIFKNHWLIDNQSHLLAQHTHSQGSNQIADKKIAIKPLTLKVIDQSTKDDNVPYAAYSDAVAPKNRDLCMRATEGQHGQPTPIEGADILIDVPTLTDAQERAALRWKVIQKSDNTVITEGTLGESAATAVLSLGSDSNVKDEILFEVQIGANAVPYVVVSALTVRVCRDRLNWWFDPFHADMTWRNAKPEPRKDTSDYMFQQIPSQNPAEPITVPFPENPFHRANAYKRESLQSIYHFLKSTEKIIYFQENAPKELQKSNWLKANITCFGEFHEALKLAHPTNPLVDLQSLQELKLASVLELPNYQTKYAALRQTLCRQGTVHIDNNPTFVTDQRQDRRLWVENAVIAIADARLTKNTLLALWVKEGSLKLNAANSNIVNFNATSRSGALHAPNPPANITEAKVVYVSDACFFGLGSDFLIKHIVTNTDNEVDLKDYTESYNHIITTADAIGSAGSGNKLFNAITATQIGQEWFVSVDAKVFYEELLRLVGLFYLQGWQTEGPDLSYMRYNMKAPSFLQMQQSIASPTYPERLRLGIEDWAGSYEIRSSEFTIPRDHAMKFQAYRRAFESRYP